MRLNAQNRQRSEQNNHRKRRDERREPPMPQRIVILIPSHSGTSSKLACVKFWRARFPNLVRTIGIPVRATPPNPAATHFGR